MAAPRTLAFASAVAAALIAAGLSSAAVGGLEYAGCDSGRDEAGDDPCTLIDGATADGESSGLFRVESVTVSRDGRWVYTVARSDDSIARFKRAANGDLSYRGCLSGDTNTPCAEIPGAVAGGTDAGLDDVRSLLLSRDGRSAYAVVANDDAIARFSRDPANGKLTFKDCITGDTDLGPGGSAACAQIDSAGDNGFNSGLDHPKSAVLSSDGSLLYVAATEDAAIARIKRNTNNGKLTFKDCITGETQSGSTGSGACEEIEGEGANGDDSGLDDPRGLALFSGGKIGKALVGVASDDDALFILQRDPDNGKLTFLTCLTGETETVTQSPGCDSLNATVDGTDSGLDDLRSLAVTRDRPDFYFVSRLDSAITHLPLDGALTCLSADIGAAGDDPCASLGTPAASGQETGFSSPESVLVSRDGRSVYVSSADDDAVTVFRRNRETGELTHKGCLTGEEESGSTGSGACEEIATQTSSGSNSGLDFPQFMALSPDDTSLYVAATGDAAVAHFRR